MTNRTRYDKPSGRTGRPRTEKTREEDERDLRILALHDRKMTFDKIGQQVQMSRSAVAGLLHRINADFAASEEQADG